jgi:two-component system alkaline phosphatase synthesis response regulator PhoP
MSKRLLLVEDEAGLRTTLGARLRHEQFEVDTAADGEAGYQKALGTGYDIIILDVMLPLRNGFDICRDLRAQGVTSPIVMLTARGETVEKVLGLKIGADDYVTKPFDTMELLARVEAVLRRSSRPASHLAVARFGAFAADFRRTELYRGPAKVILSGKEFQLLQYFLEHRGETLSRDELLREVWGYDSTSMSRTVDVHVAWLRQKIEDDPRQPRWIITLYGLGYKFSEEIE